MGIKDEKKILRGKFLRNRQILENKQVDLSRREIIKKLLEIIKWKTINNIHIYRSMVNKKEVDTSNLIDWIRKNHPEINVIIAPTKKPFDLPKNENYDLVIVPVLGFDRFGNRLGYGGGYYDKLLSQNKCKKIIGLAYSFCEVERLPVEDHDKKLDMVITESRVISF